MSKAKVGGRNKEVQVKKDMVRVLRNGKVRFMTKDEYEATKPEGA
jgi:hypothetical protein